MPARDDFKTRTKRLLKDGVNGICSRPECRASTLGAHTDPTKTPVNVGVAAHICAAAPLGPRFDKNMTPAQRAHFDNGIWLCQSCSTFIDKDTERFTPSILRRWKAEAEKTSRQSVGRRVPTEQDSRDQVLMMLSGVAASNQPNLIANAHAASRTVLEQLDPRLAVETAFDGVLTRYTFNAREPVRVEFDVGEPAAAAWQSALVDLVKHGRAIELPSDDIRMKGSPVFEQLRPSEYAGGKISVIPTGRPAIAKLALRDPASGVLFSINDAPGTLTGGTESTSFSGASLGGLFSIHLEVPRARRKVEGLFTISTDFESWVGRDVSDLPYFAKLFRFYELAKEGWLLDLVLEMDGNDILKLPLDVPSEEDVFMYAYTTLAYCDRARVLAKHLGQRLEFRLEPPFSAEQHRELAKLADIARGKHAFSAAEVGDIVHILKAGERGENIRMLRTTPGPHQIVLTAASDPEVVYGQEMALPHLRRVFDDVTAHIDPNVAADSAAKDDDVPVTWVKGPAFKLTHEFETKVQETTRVS